MEVTENYMKMSLDELIEEHKRVVAVLESDSKEDDKREAETQKKELDKYIAKKKTLKKGEATVKQHYRTNKKTGKKTLVKQHTTKKKGKKTVEEVKQSRKAKKAAEKEKIEKLALKVVKDKESAQAIVAKYKNNPINLSIMTNGKWTKEEEEKTITNEDGEEVLIPKKEARIILTDQQKNDLVRENSGLIHNIVAKVSKNPALYDDLRQVAEMALFMGVNDYNKEYNPSNPKDIVDHFGSRIRGRVQAEMNLQVASRFRLPHQKAVIYRKFVPLWEEHSGDYDKIYDALKLKKKDTYPSISPTQKEHPLPKEGYVSVTKEHKIKEKTKEHEEKMNAIKEDHLESKAALAGRAFGATKEDKIAYAAGEKQLDARIEKLTAKISDKKTTKSERFDLEKKITALEKTKTAMGRMVKPLDDEQYAKEIKVLDSVYTEKTRREGERFKKELGKTSIQGAFNLFRELETIMSFKNVNMSGQIDLGEGEGSSIESTIKEPSSLNPEEKVIIKEGFISNMEKLTDAINSLEPKTAMVLNMHLGLDEKNKPYPHGLWGYPMDLSETVRNLPVNLYRRSGYDKELAKWESDKPKEVMKIRLTPEEVKKEKAKLKKWEKNREKAKAELKIKRAKVKGAAAKAKLTEGIHKKHGSRVVDKPTQFASKERKLNPTELKAMTQAWTAKKPKESISERATYERVKRDLGYGKVLLRQILPAKVIDDLMVSYSDMRYYGIRKGHVKEDLRKSMIVDTFFGYTLKLVKRDEDKGIIQKAYNKVRNLFKMLKVA